MANQNLSISSVQPQNHTVGQQPQKKESTFDSIVSKLSANKLAVGAAVLGVSLFALSRSERVCDFTAAVADLSKEGIAKGFKLTRAKGSAALEVVKDNANALKDSIDKRITSIRLGRAFGKDFTEFVKSGIQQVNTRRENASNLVRDNGLVDAFLLSKFGI